MVWQSDCREIRTVFVKYRAAWGKFRERKCAIFVNDLCTIKFNSSV